MEQQHNMEHRRTAGPTGREVWETSPHRPAVFVIDTEAFDRGALHGRWINPNDDPLHLKQQLSALLGRQPDRGTWAVVDQVGLGPVMVPETLDVEELREAVEELKTPRSPS
ncbi:MAG TPA: hypothetical protein VNA57_00140 [Acidimicrobiales bacterium]|nr:hypothetical protein [Acidimicrobiales bacterium]